MSQIVCVYAIGWAGPNSRTIALLSSSSCASFDALLMSSNRSSSLSGRLFFCWKTGKVVACEVCGRLYLLPSSLHGDGCRISFLSGLFTQSKVFLILCKSYSPWSTGLDAPAHRQVGRTVCGDCWQRRGVPKLSVQYVYGKSGGSVFYDKLPTPLKKWPADHHSVRMWDG